MIKSSKKTETADLIHLDTEFLWGNLKERDYLEDLGLDGRMTLKLIVEELG
jgi:hypothetical protein